MSIHEGGDDRILKDDAEKLHNGINALSAPGGSGTERLKRV